jgi:hypothetical protein
MFGTFLYSEPRGSFKLGLPNNESEHFQSVVQLYTVPFINVAKMAGKRLPAEGTTVQPETAAALRSQH